jgi:hypothetical protein
MEAPDHHPDGSWKTRHERGAVEESPGPDGLRRAENMNGATIDKTDLELIQAELAGRDSLRLLEEIPEVNAMKFVDQTKYPGQPEKLLVGHRKGSNDDIYAYVVQHGKTLRINFFVESGSESTLIIAAAIGRDEFGDPFNKTIPSDKALYDKNRDRARLTLMIRYYFLAAGKLEDYFVEAGKLKGVVIKEFANQVRLALEYIADSIAVEPRKVIANRHPSSKKDGTEQRITSKRSFGESDIQSTLGGNPPRISPQSMSTRRKQTVAPETAPSLCESTPLATFTGAGPSVTPRPETTPTSMLPPPTLEHTAEDAQLEELFTELVKYREFTSQLCAIGHSLDVMEGKKQDFMAKWMSETNALKEERARIFAARESKRKRILPKRQRVSSATVGEDL